jgi:predicted Zn-dependent peptidase
MRVLAVFGDVDPEALRQSARNPPSVPGKTCPARPCAQSGPAVTPTPRSEESREKEQAVLALGFPGTQLT